MGSDSVSDAADASSSSSPDGFEANFARLTHRVGTIALSTASCNLADASVASLPASSPGTLVLGSRNLSRDASVNVSPDAPGSGSNMNLGGLASLGG